MKKLHRILPAFTILFCLILTGCGAGKPKAPIEVNFRQSALDSAGLVLQVHNISDKHLSSIMTAQNKLAKEVTKYSFDLAPHGSKEIGLLECNWTFKTGEGVWIETEGYSTVQVLVP